jgi:ribosomal protein L4
MRNRVRLIIGTPKGGGTTFSAKEQKEYEARCARRARKAALAKQEAARCKENALRLIAEQSR